MSGLAEKKPVRPLRESQRRASDPASSAWVAANAGSGKTFVLAHRVLRLLLDGSPPDRLLCLTFTKAAASEMANRVCDALRDWATASDDELNAALQAIDNRPISDIKRIRARTLFAKALETPGGLKIQTIHAFAEQLLNRFPFEAKVAAQFAVVDEMQAAGVLRECRDAVLRQAVAKPESALGKALSALIVHASEERLDTLLNEVLQQRGAFLEWIGAHDGCLEAALDALRGALDLKPGDSLASVRADLVTSDILPRDRWPAVIAALRGTGKASEAGFASRLEAARHAKTEDMCAAAYVQAFATVSPGEGLRLRARLFTKALETEAPGIAEALTEEKGRLGSILERYKALHVFEASSALFTLADAVLSKYVRAKAAQSVLDYDDLIEKAGSLLEGRAAAWVLFKLDYGIDHVLVDEAQDTSPAQWSIVAKIAEEFFAGEGARSMPRTIFAVGDEKQSIFSFQGADPQAFDRMRNYFASRVEQAEKAFDKVQLLTSFRTVPEVLRAVDAVFSEAAVHRGVSADTIWPPHQAERTQEKGLVEIWPLVEPPEETEPDLWTMPLDEAPPHSPPVKCADNIASVIRGWLDKGTPLAPGGRAIAPSDIMILVRRRGVFAEAMIRALKQRRVPVAGADRLRLTEHIAVMDLLAAAECALLPEDDLTLATVLKSPLIGFDDDDLIALAPEREGTLWAALRATAQTPDGRYGRVVARIQGWLAMADTLRPFDFFSTILAAEGGRRAFRERLGLEADDPLDEFLALALSYEAGETPSLQGFLCHMQSADHVIKRDMDDGKGTDGGEVRVMTVHGAKGLEAGVVFLADTASVPAGQTVPPVLPLDHDGLGPFPLAWTVKGAYRTVPVMNARDAYLNDADAEYRRLLYVAMTRARDRLYICGHKGNRAVPGNAWYSIVSDARLPGARDVADPYGLGFDVIRIASFDDVSDTSAKAGAALKAESGGLPAWCGRVAPTQPQKPRFAAPSSAWLAEGQDIGQSIRHPAGQDVAQNWAALRGRAIHALLQHAPEPGGLDAWRAAADDHLANALDSADEAMRLVIRNEAEAVFRDPACSVLFDPQSRAEVPVVGRLPGLGPDGSDLFVSGIVDRVAFEGNTLVFADFKTALGFPDTPGEADHAILKQMAVYREVLAKAFPAHEIKALLVWTAGPSVMPLDAALFEAHIRPDPAP